MKILVTGGTVFVSCYLACYFQKKGHEVYVLNRGSRIQPEGTQLLKIDRHQPYDLSHIPFDVVIDVTAYTKADVQGLLQALDLSRLQRYVLISSSAVYGQDDPQPFLENYAPKANRYWGQYGIDKAEAEKALQENFAQHYIIRPPYLYGPGNVIYRESFVFDCALADRPFYLPDDGQMQLQFFYIGDLARLVETLLEKAPEEHIFNVGNPVSVSVREWVDMCYQIAGRTPTFKNVDKEVDIRSYFPFHRYEYQLDTTLQNRYFTDLTPLMEGLNTSFKWYEAHSKLIIRRPYLKYIQEHLE